MEEELLENIQNLEESRENFRNANDTLSEIQNILKEGKTIDGKPIGDDIIKKLNDTSTELTSKLSEYSSEFETSLDKTFETISKKENININSKILEDTINNNFDGKNKEVEDHLNKLGDNIKDKLYDKDGNRVEDKETQKSKIEKILHYGFIGFTAIGVISSLLIGLDGKDFNSKNIFSKITKNPTDSGTIGCTQLNLETGELKPLGICNNAIVNNSFGSCSGDPNRVGPFCDELSGMPCPNSYLACLKCSNDSKNIVISPVCIGIKQLYLALTLLDQYKDQLEPLPVSTNIIKVVSIVILIVIFILYIIYYVYKYK
jgi:hypothetical protein